MDVLVLVFENILNISGNSKDSTLFILKNSFFLNFKLKKVLS